VRRRSTVDFFGVLHRLPVAFEAKTTQQRLFRLDKITQGQLAFLERFVVNSGCGFVLLNFDVPRAAATFVLSHRWLVQAAGSNPDGQLVTLDVCRAADAALQPCVQVKHGEAGVPIHFAPGVLELHHRMGQHAHEQASA
jgi:penicillin-binding protein-related factor A (putative recombinase)